MRFSPSLSFGLPWFIIHAPESVTIAIGRFLHSKFIFHFFMRETVARGWIEHIGTFYQVLTGRQFLFFNNLINDIVKHFVNLFASSSRYPEMLRIILIHQKF